MPEQQPANTQLNIEISEEVSEGVYANLAIITHSHAAFSRFCKYYAGYTKE